MNPIDPKYRAKVYKALTSEMGLKKTEEQFYYDLDNKDGYADKVYNALKNELKLTRDKDEFLSLVVKKKDDGVGTVTASELDANTKDLPGDGLSDGKDYSKQLNYISKADARQEQEYLKQEEELKPLLDNYKQKVEIPTESTRPEAEQKAADMDKNQGFGWYKNFKDFVYSGLATQANPIFSFLKNPNKIGNLEEKKQIAQQIADQKKIKLEEVSQEEISQVYKSNKTQELLDAQKEKLTEEFLENLPKEEKEKLENHFRLEASVVGVKGMQKMFDVENLGNEINSIVEELNKRKSQYESDDPSAIYPESFFQENVELAQQLNNKIDLQKKKYDEFLELSDNLMSTEKEIDLFKRNYNKLVNMGAKTGIAFANMGLDISKFMDKFSVSLLLTDQAGDLLGLDILERRNESRENVRQWLNESREGLAKNQSLEDIEGLEDLTEWLLDTTADQSANITLMLATGGMGSGYVPLTLMGASSGGNKLQQLEQEEKDLGVDYKWWQEYGSAAIAAFTEAASEKITLGQLNHAKRVFKTATEKQLKESMGSYLKNRVFNKTNTKKYFKDMLEEGGSEGLVTLTENITGNLLLDKDTFILDGVGESIVTGAVMSGVIYKFPTLLGPMTMPFRKKDTNQKIGEAWDEIQKINTEIETEGISAPAKEMLEQKRKNLTEEVSTLVTNDLKNVESLTKQQKTELISMEKQRFDLRKKAQQIADDTSISEQTKDTMLKELASEIDILNTAKESVLDSAEENETEPKNINSDETQTQRDSVIDADVSARDSINNTEGQNQDIPSDDNTRTSKTETSRPTLIQRGNNTYSVSKENDTLIVRNQNNEVPSKPTERSVLKEYANTYDFTEGEKYTPIEGERTSDFDSQVSSQSNNPSQLAEVILRTQKDDFINNNLDTRSLEIIEYIQGEVKRGSDTPLNDGSFTSKSDKNNITPSIAKTYLRSSGRGLDVLAQELSEQMGVEITEQNIVDVMLQYPNGVNDIKKEVRDQYSNPAKQRFTELTGFPASDFYLQKAVEQSIAKEELNEEIYNNYLLYLSDSELQDLDNEINNYEEALNKGAISINEASDTTKGKEQPGNRETSNSEDEGKKPISEEKVANAREALDWYNKNRKNFIEEVLTSFDGKLDPDNLREKFRAIGYDGKNVPLFRLAEKQFVNDVFDRLLESNQYNEVVFLTGVGGSGKSNAASTLKLSEDSFVFDSAFNSFERLDQVLTKAKNAGKEISVVSVYNDAKTSFTNTLNRGVKTGRFLSLNYFIDAFTRNQDKLKKLLEKYPEISLTTIDNSGNEIKSATIESALNWDYTLSDSVIEELIEIINNEKGRFNENQLASITEGLQQITGSKGERTDRMERLSQEINSRAQGLRQEKPGDILGDEVGSSIRLNENNTEIEDDSELVANSLNPFSNKNRPDPTLSEEGPVGQKDERQRNARRFWNKTIRTNAGINAEVAEIVRSQINMKADIMNTLQYEARVFKKIANAATRKVSKEKARNRLLEINKYLAGDRSANISFLSVDQIKDLDYFRQRIDENSEKLIEKLENHIQLKQDKIDYESFNDGQIAQIQNSIQATQNLIETIEENKGTYLNRSYQAFADDKYIDRLKGDRPTKASKIRIDNAVKYLLNESSDLFGTQITEQEARAKVFGYLEGLRNDNNFLESLIKGNAKSDFFKKKKEIPKPFRELLGEINDPITNYVSTVYKVSSFLANVEYQQNLEKTLEDTGLLSREAKEGYTLLVPQTEGWNHLNGIWVPTEAKQSIEDINPLGYVQDAGYRRVIALAGLVKLGKTVLSPTTAFRNIISGNFLSWNAGFAVTDPVKAMHSLSLAWGNKKTFEQNRSETSKLIKLGILKDGATSREITAILNDFSKKRDQLLNQNVPQKLFEAAQRFYALGDDSYKVYGFYTYVDRYKKSGYTQAESDKKAALRIKDTFPTYSMLPKNIQSLRRIPYVGTFVSFPYEVLRTTYNNAKYLGEDIKEGRKSMAIKQFAGMVAANATASALSAYTMGLVGINDQEDDVIRNMSPEWQKDSLLIYFGKDQSGEPIFMDATAMFPSETLLKPFRILFEEREGRDMNDKLVLSFTETLKPFLGLDVSFQGIINLINNKNNFNQSLYDGDTLAQGIFNDPGAISNYVLKQMGPGIYNNISEFARANNIAPEYFGDKLTNYGREYNNRDALLALFGLRFTTMNYGAGMFSLGYEIKDNMNTERGEAMSQLKTSRELSLDEIQDIVDEYTEKNNEQGKKALQMVKGAYTLQMTEERIIKALLVAGYSKRDIAFLFNNEIPIAMPASRQTMTSQFNKIDAVQNEDKKEPTKNIFVKNVEKFNNAIIEKINQKK